MSSMFAPVPQKENGGPLLKFAEVSIFATGPYTAKNGVEYWKFECNATPYIDPDNIPTDPKEMEVKKWKTMNAPWNPEFKPFWSSICAEGHDAAGKKAWQLLPAFEALGTPDALFTAPSEPTKIWLVSYQTPVFLVPAKPDDLKYAQENNAFHTIQKDETTGQIMKKKYPWRLVNLYTDRAIWEADAKANAMASGTPTPAKEETTPDKAAALTHLPVLVKASGLNLATLENILNSNPHMAKFFNINSPEVRLEVARLIIGAAGPQNEEGIKTSLENLNGGNYLNLLSPEVVTMREEIPF